MKFESMTDKEIFSALKTIAQTLSDEVKFIDEVSSGKFLIPRKPSARFELIQSHRRLMAKLQMEADELYSSLLDRWSKISDK